MKILFVSPEAAPFARTGGLADVAGSLPRALNEQGADVRVVVPRYDKIDVQWRRRFEPGLATFVHLGRRRQRFALHRLNLENIPFYFIENEYYFDRPELYGYQDDCERFSFFCRAVEEMLPLMDWRPDIICCSGWQTALLPLLLREHDAPLYRGMKSVYIIHDLDNQGIFPIETAREQMGLSQRLNSSGILELDGMVNLVKAAVCRADTVITVSPAYARELRDPAHAGAIGQVIEENAFKLRGIINGIDPSIWDPVTDQRTYYAFSKKDLSGKAVNKSELQRELGLDMEKRSPVIACVNHLAGRKGMNLVAEALEAILAKGFQLTVIGSGEPELEAFFKNAAASRPEAVAVAEYTDVLAARVYAGSDMLLMPSLYEPCGLQQMRAMRYGTVPIVRETGGLKDTVRPYPASGSNGFSFSYFSARDMLTALESALALWKGGRVGWEALMRRCMDTDFGWERSAAEYMKIFNRL